MTSAQNIDLSTVLADERLTTTRPDVLRELLATFIHTLMGAGYGERSAQRTNSATANATVNSTPAQ